MRYAKLRGKIKEIYGQQSKFADAIDIDPSTLSAKLTGRVEWKRDEIAKVCQTLHIPLDEIAEYFF